MSGFFSSIKNVFRKPPWKHADHRVRLDAVKTLDNQAVLAQLARNDPYNFKLEIDTPFYFYPVRDAAIKKLTDMKTLKDLQKSDNYYSRRSAEERLHFLEYGAPKAEPERDREDWDDARNDLDPHQSPFGFKRGRR